MRVHVACRGLSLHVFFLCICGTTQNVCAHISPFGLYGPTTVHCPLPCSLLCVGSCQRGFLGVVFGHPCLGGSSSDMLCCKGCLCTSYAHIRGHCQPLAAQGTAVAGQGPQPRVLRQCVYHGQVLWHVLSYETASHSAIPLSSTVPHNGLYCE
jgi:hypothetical protein